MIFFKCPIMVRPAETYSVYWRKW